MRFDMQRDGDIVVITPRGSLEGGPDIFQVKDEVKTYLTKGDRKFILDMAQVGFVNSTGIGVAVSLLSSIMGNQGTLHVCAVSERARKSFVVTGVWGLFKSFDTLAEAKAAFR
jgi:stage II sporulation protein AA (anti-sigma F factor antagonist)